MSHTTSSLQGTAYCKTTGSTQETHTRRARRWLTGMLTVVLLAGCASNAPLLPDTATEDQSTQATAAPVSRPAKPKRSIRVRDILVEWGTFGLERRSKRKARVARARKVEPSAPLMPAEYSKSILEIMANETCNGCEEKPYHAMVLEASDRHGVPPALIHAVIQKESGYNPTATSPRKARGLMQITARTGRFLGVDDSRDLYDPEININAGAAYLKYLMGYHDTVEEVLAAYNAGPGNVRKYNGIPPFRETQRYVKDVKSMFELAAGDE